MEFLGTSPLLTLLLPVMTAVLTVGGSWAVLKRDVTSLGEYKSKTLELLNSLHQAQTDIAVLSTRVDALKESVDGLSKQILDMRSASRIVTKST